MKNILKYLAIASFSFLFASCDKKNDDTPNPTINKVKVGEAYVLGAATKVQLWADADLSTGYNQLFIVALDSVSNQQKTEATFAIKPLMTMTMDGGMTMQHSCPFEQANASGKKDNLTPAAAVFSMPSSDSGFWEMEVTLNNHKKVLIPINVKEPAASRLVMITTPAPAKVTYLVALIPNPTYKIGANDFELLVTKKINGMTYEPVNDLSIEITPEMPDMGHGSPNNVNPIFAGNGRYKGKVNFTMTGYWKVNLQINGGDNTVITDDAAFKITF